MYNKEIMSKLKKLITALSTRLNDYAQTFRASYYKNGERNIVQNITDGNGYEGVIEIWQIISKDK